MKKDMKIDKKLTSGNKGSLPFPKMGTKNLLVIGEVQSTGLSTVLDSKVSSDPLKKGLNFHSFLIDKKLTNKVGGSLPLLKNGTKRSVVLIDADKVGLSTVLGSKSSSAPLNLGLNFTFFGELL